MGIKQRQHSIDALDVVTVGTVSFRVLAGTRVALVQTEIGEAYVLSLSADHAVAVIPQDHHGDAHI